MDFQRFQLAIRFWRVRKTLGKPPGIPSSRLRKKPKESQWFCRFPLQIQGTAPQDGSGIQLAQEGRTVKTYGFNKVFKDFRCAVRYFFILLTAHSPRNAETQGLPTFLQRFRGPMSIFFILLRSLQTVLQTQALFMLYGSERDPKLDSIWIPKLITKSFQY